MSETENIAKLAENISKDIFKWLKWEQSQHFNINSNCVLQSEDEHNKITHPSDTVFNYIDPYSGKRIYLLTDLKSYAVKSINKTTVQTGLINLAQSIECSVLSEDWQSKFIEDENEVFEVAGLLFIYNHDGEFDKNFANILHKIKNENLNIPQGQKLYVLEPNLISYTYNIVTDMKILKGEDKLPKIEDITFYYPDMVITKRQDGDEWGRPATIESLSARWLIIKYKPIKNEQKDGYIIYYRNAGETIDEFIYLIDTLSNYQLLSSENDIEIRLFDSDKNAVDNFEKAKKQYVSSWGFDENKKRDLEYITAKRVNKVKTTYSDVDIGMRI